MQEARTHAAAMLQLVAKRGCVIMLDFDGTLAPIVPTPAKAHMSERTRAIVSRLAARYPVGVITGRSLRDIRTRVRVPHVSFSGNHGYEWYVQGRLSRIRVSDSTRSRFLALRKRLRTLPRLFPGVLIEDKGSTLSLHYRGVAKAQAGPLREHIRRLVGTSARMIPGVLVWNILPRVRVDKGTAAHTMFRALRRARSNVPIFIGDDITDEYAFRALEGGITVLVGKKKNSRAHYYVRSRTDVDWLLSALAAM